MTWPYQAAEHNADHRKPDEGGGGAGVSLQNRAPSGDCDCSTPGFVRQIQRLGGTTNLCGSLRLTISTTHWPALAVAQRDARSLIAGIGEDAFDEGEEAARASIENQSRPVAVLNVGGMDDDVQQKAERIDKDVALAPDDLLARIKPLRVKRGAPF